MERGNPILGAHEQKILAHLQRRKNAQGEEEK